VILDEFDKVFNSLTLNISYESEKLNYSEINLKINTFKENLKILRKEYSSLILHRKCPISISHGSAGQITGTRYAPEVSAAPACI